MYPYSFKEELRNSLCCDALLEGGQNRHPGKAINNHKNTVISPLGGWKTQHVVHLDGFPQPIRSRHRGVQALFLSGWFGNSTASAGPDILAEILLKFRPVEICM
jgi:hypothetical protein